MERNKEFYNFIWLLLIVFSVMAGLSFFLEKQLNISLFNSVWAIYLFHSIFTFCILFGLNFVAIKMKDYVAMAFLAFSFFQILGSIVFLIPLISAEFNNKIPDVFFFMLPYFVSLFLQVMFCLKLLREEKTQ